MSYANCVTFSRVKTKMFNNYKNALSRRGRQIDHASFHPLFLGNFMQDCFWSHLFCQFLTDIYLPNFKLLTSKTICFRLVFFQRSYQEKVLELQGSTVHILNTNDVRIKINNHQIKYINPKQQFNLCYLENLETDDKLSNFIKRI